MVERGDEMREPAAFDELARAWMRFGAEMEQVPDEALDTLEARIRRQTETNCSWGAYEVGPRVLTFIDNERRRRKFERENVEVGS